MTEGNLLPKAKTASRRAAVLAAVVAVAAPAAAIAALPAAKSKFQAHDHVTEGKNWHVEMTIGKDPQTIDQLVIYAEQCNVTAVKKDVPISDAGDVAVSAPVKGGSWDVSAHFPEADHVTGTLHVAKGDCDTGPIPFDVKEGADEDHDDMDMGGDGHAHHHHHHHGPKFPDIDSATAAQRKQAEDLRIRVRRAAATRFKTYRAARALNYKRFPRKWKLPVVFHLRNRAYENDNRIFDPRRPESLVYWWPRHGQPILLGFMFRAPAGPRPSFAGPIPIYHQHPNRYGKLGDNQMTHVWLTGGLRSAWSNCLPVKQLERANPKLRYEKPRSGVSGQESMPC